MEDAIFKQLTQERRYVYKNPEGNKGTSRVEIWGRVFQDRRNSGAKTPRQERVCCVGVTVRRLVWLEQSEQNGG